MPTILPDGSDSVRGRGGQDLGLDRGQMQADFASNVVVDAPLGADGQRPAACETSQRRTPG